VTFSTKAEGRGATGAVPFSVVSFDPAILARPATPMGSIITRTLGDRQIALVRHPPVLGGEGLCYGRLDLPLANPEVDIPDLVARLEPMRGATIWTSPLSRCRLVAEALALAWDGAAVQVDARLVEMSFGDWEGMRWGDVQRTELEAWAADLSGFALPGGETGAALVERVTEVWGIIKGYPGGQVVVSHGGPLKVMI
jgi:alpha-ribazole phosphatase